MESKEQSKVKYYEIPNISGDYIFQGNSSENGKGRKIRQSQNLVKVIYQNHENPGYGQVYYNPIKQAFYLKFWNTGGKLYDGKIMDGSLKIIFQDGVAWKKI